jgi:hypothetical protein
VSNQNVSGNNNIFSQTGDIYYSVSETRSADRVDRANLLLLADKVRTFWISGVLNNSLLGLVAIQLHREGVQDAVEHPWERVLELPQNSVRALTLDESIADVFRGVGYRLLILGEPGSGKTTTMLQLAEQLLSDFYRDGSKPVPVVLSLSSWAEGPLLKWLVAELREKYQIASSTAKKWIEAGQVLPLLDGLDETLAERRDACVDVINHAVLPGVVVCSRLAEYRFLARKLKLNGAIIIKPLTSEQVEQYLESAGDHLVSLRIALQTDAELAELTRLPLMLGILAITYFDRVLSFQGSQRAPRGDELEDRIFQNYVERMFSRRTEISTRLKRDISQYLRWLAGEMNRRSNTVFMLDSLQLSWLGSVGEIFAYLLLSRICFGLGLGVLLGSLAGALRYPNLLGGGLVNDAVGRLFELHPDSGLNGPLMSRPELLWRHVLEVLGGVAVAVPTAIGLSAILAVVQFALVRRAMMRFDRVHGTSWGASAVASGLLCIAFCLFTFLGRGDGPWDVSDILRFGASIGPILLARAIVRDPLSDIKFSGSVRWVWAPARKGAFWGATAAGPITGITSAMIVLFTDNPYVGGPFFAAAIFLVNGIGAAIIGGVMGAIISGLVEVPIEEGSRLNQGVYLTLRNLRNASFVSFGVSALLYFPVAVYNDALPISALRLFFFGCEACIFALIVSGLITLWYGGIDVICHYALRFILYVNGHAPLRQARLLLLSVQLIFLQKVGGGVIFVHRALLEYFMRSRLI